jgi:hypothetical protein
MTQDQSGQAQGTGYVVRGEVVPDDETAATEAEESGPMTRFKKVASVLRGDRPAQEAGEPTGVSDEEYAEPADPNYAQTADPNYTQTTDPTYAQTTDPNYTEAAGPDEVSAVRSPNAAGGDYWDERDADATIPDEMSAGQDSAADPAMTGPGTYTATAPTPTVPAPGYAGDADVAREADMADMADTRADVADTRAGYGSPAGADAEYGNQAGTLPGHESPVGTALDDGDRADIGTGPQGPVSTGPTAATGAATAGAATAGDAAAGSTAAGAATAGTAADAGLRPGEATDRIGDFGDIAFGNLLPDAEQYTARWQQIQFRFVDDPQASVTEAADVVSQVTTKLEAAIRERQQAIEERQRAIEERASALRGRWGEGANADTETLRETLRMYKAFMDQLVGPTA